MRVFLITFVGEKRVELKPGLNLTGRADTCELVVDHKSVSHHHCVLSIQDGTILVRDLDSSNGTLINGQKIKKGTLQNGDVLSVGAIRFQVSIVREEDTNIQLDVEKSGRPTSSPGGRKTSTPEGKGSKPSKEPTPNKEPKSNKDPKSNKETKPNPESKPSKKPSTFESSDDFLI